MEAGRIAAGEVAPEHVRHPEVAELALGEVRPDDVNVRLEVLGRRLDAERLEEYMTCQLRMLISAPDLSFGMIDRVPVVPDDVITSSGVCASSASIDESMSVHPLTLTLDRSCLVSLSSHAVSRS